MYASEIDVYYVRRKDIETMGIFDLFSKRQRRLRGEFPDVYTYDNLPKAFRVQIVHIIRDALGVDGYMNSNASQMYEFINNTLCREYGVFELTANPRSLQESVFNFFLTEQVVERALDVIEISFRGIDIFVRENYHGDNKEKIELDDAIAELNGRFKEHGIGFQFESSELIRVDSDFIHSEAVKPTLAILRDKKFKGANEEFLNAHEHYRHGRYKECLVDALKSFESTLKAICERRGWKTQPTDTAKALINTCLNEGLLPTFLESQMGSVRSLLESGLPTVRNKLGGARSRH
jgi:hypothetical protein